MTFSLSWPQIRNSREKFQFLNGFLQIFISLNEQTIWKLEEDIIITKKDLDIPKLSQLTTTPRALPQFLP